MGRDRRTPRAASRAVSLDRRELLRLGLGAVTLAAACKGEGADTGADTGEDLAGTCGPEAPTQAGDTSAVADPGWQGDPFQLGVASGDPLHDRVILWTRLCPDPVDVAQTPAEEVELVWELGADPELTEVLQAGVVKASPELAHAVHVDVDGLEPDTVYWYRFRLGEHESPVGRTRTLPCADAALDWFETPFRVAFATCQKYSAGFYAAHRDLAEHQPDLVVFLGDYIYESGGSGVRDHSDGVDESFALDEYRNRYGLYRSDPDLQASHAAAPWVPTWDDHEVENNYAGSVDSGGTGGAAWDARRAAAYRAWYEHMPVRMAPPEDDSLPLHRSVRVGELLEILVLDGRQHRDPQPCEGQAGQPCEEVWDEDRDFLGPEQEAWVAERLAAGPARWTLFASPVVMLPMDFGGVFVNPDQWDGYPLARQRLLDALDAHGVTDALVFSGDIHASGVGWIPDDPADPSSGPRVTEFVVPAATSGATEDLEALGPLLALQEHIDWWDFVGKGWVLAELSAERVTVRYRICEDVRFPETTVSEARVWEVVAGSPGAVEVG